mmetsp:Transcript_901/g.2083  ORF Transcript_901/g.2083 Transcript_901/m.2083 type:complete len:420 (+) Transcript_901:122-1381(+)|eukprot:CAMPEP_0168182354 /NCGR_PEP_ID=MMETSP0139_2-20121125/11852_1 /TAXON_ID=44445 /ORGANISM="Pseudo-nitzschia australis, Strain 10249 10 AB" /LENGTH=419 /DNA_ID=CAMNT_0008103285 /DNA_START=39 /DNA_END=1298 /DNA_ORIENTATION=+
MKLNLAATLIATSVAAIAGSDRNAVNNAASVSHRGLAISLEDRLEVTSVLKERRSSKNKGKVIRNLQRKLRDGGLRNVEGRDADDAADDLDLGIFSRRLQSNITEDEADQTVMEQLLDICANDGSDPSFSCECSNLDVDGYTASIFCTYEEECLDATKNICGEEVTFCFVETYMLDVAAPGSGSSSICYNVSEPVNFNYCYGLQYVEESIEPSGCSMEIDGNSCNLCAFTTNPIYPNVTCNTFDCSNTDETIGEGIICGEDTVVSAKIQEYLTYAPLPCDGGCNICPLNGDMGFLDNNVTMITNEVYPCWELNLAAQVGYLSNMPGDLCNSLPAIVNEPCGCNGGVTTAPPEPAPSMPTVEEPSGAPIASEVSGDITIASVPDPPTETPTVSSNSATVNLGFAFATTVLAATFSWVTMV